METLTMKFGGTSVGSAEAIEQVVDIVRDAKEQARNVAIVVSAMNGITNLLQEGLLTAASGNAKRYPEIVKELRARHEDTARALFKVGSLPPAPPEAEAAMASLLDDMAKMIQDYRAFCDSVRVLGEVTPRVLDFGMGLGERISARMIAAAMNQRGIRAQAVDATGLIVTDSQFQSAAPLMDATEARVQEVLIPLLKEDIVPVITGFVGANKKGIPTTLGRGGSDFSAAIVGVALHSDEVWIWTDVDGVMSADPRVVPEARIIDALSYREISELAFYGAKVLHPKTIRPVLEAGITLRVRNTFNTAHPGTVIIENGKAGRHKLKAVTMVRDLTLLTVEGKGMLGVPGIAARTFSAVARTGTSVLLITQSSSEQSICFVVPHPTYQSVVETLNKEFAQEIKTRDIDEIWVKDDIAIVTVVGAGLRDAPGVAGRILTATGSCEVNVIAIAQGSAECSISLVVNAGDGDTAVKAIHPLTL